MKQTPIQKAIGILEKVKKNITDKTQINDLDCVINSYKTELLPYEEKYIAEQLGNSKTNIENCDCEIPKPIDAYHEIDKFVCKDCSGYIQNN